MFRRYVGGCRGGASSILLETTRNQGQEQSLLSDHGEHRGKRVGKLLEVGSLNMCTVAMPILLSRSRPCSLL